MKSTITKISLPYILLSSIQFLEKLNSKNDSINLSATSYLPFLTSKKDNIEQFTEFFNGSITYTYDEISSDNTSDGNDFIDINVDFHMK